MLTILLILTLLLTFFTQPLNSSTSTQIHHNRRILHQPLFPIDHSFPPTTQPQLQPPFPSPPPQPQPQQQQPKYPFSYQTPPNIPQLFFPFYPSPPPPPPPPPSPHTSLATFPANISSLILPQSPSSSEPISRKKLIAVAVSVSLFSALLIAALAAFLLLHYHRDSFFNKKTARTDGHNLFPPNTASSDAFSKPPTGVPNSNEGNEDPKACNLNRAGASSVVLGYQRLGSPELHPLPPLPRQDFGRNINVGPLEDDDNDEEFFSPRGSSSGDKESPNGNISNSRRCFEADNSVSPTQSMSSSPSITLNLSPRSLISKSPDSVVNFPAPPRPIPPPMPRERRPERNSGDTLDYPSRISEQNLQSPVIKDGVSRQYIPVKLQPPPPPPPPPPRFWETTVVPTPFPGPPVLVTPSRPVVFQNPPTISPMDEEIPKPKLKPLHWDKVRASSDRAMVWDHLKSSSFQLNEEMIETLFMVNSSNLASKDSTRRPILMSMDSENRVLDLKKSQNIAILLRALNVTVDEVCEALVEGNADMLGSELLESLLKMAPTKEEERNLKEFKDESPFKLGPAEKFLRALLDIPFAFKRVDAMLYMANFDSEFDYLERSFETLQEACEELRNSRMFMKLLDAVLKTGNRMNIGTKRGDAHAFKLDTLVKLVDVKGTDGKTTLLHFVVQEIIRAEGSRLSGTDQSPIAEKGQQSAFRDDVEFRKLGLQVVSSLSGELTNVKKAASKDSDVLSSEVIKLATGFAKIHEVVELNEELELKESSRNFSASMNGFLKKAGEKIVKIQDQEDVALSMVKEITKYFHGDSVKEEAHPFRIFIVVRDFLSILDQVCKEVGKINERTVVSSGRQIRPSINSNLVPVFPGFNATRHYSSSDDESSSSL